jgi:hypothetical protein
MTWIVWNLVLLHLDIVLVSVQDSSTVSAKSTIGTKFILDALDGTPRFEAQMEIVLILTQDRCMVWVE